MASHLNPTQLLNRLRQPDEVGRDPFTVLQSISLLINNADTLPLGREMVLRALELRGSMGVVEPILDSLARSTGLFPYADPEALDLADRIAYEYHRPANMTEDVVFHRMQAEVYRRLLSGENVILSAPTSFGKSRVIDAMIATRQFKNVAVIVPTLALIDETRRRFATFSGHYKIVTHLSQPPGERNIFVFTAERAVAYARLPTIDFFVIDEFYKIGAIEEDEARTVALNEAFYRLRKGGGQFYLLGPNIQRIPAGLEEAFRCTFVETNFSTVVVESIEAPGKGKQIDRLLSLLRTLEEPTLIYCSSPTRVNSIARDMINAGLGVRTPALSDAASWVAATYDPNWIYGLGLIHGIGIHHGSLPRSLAQFVVRAFNEEQLRFLICTSTLIEGVNTRAKNVVIWDFEDRESTTRLFYIQQYSWRSGRMFHHFVGRVFLFKEPPTELQTYVNFPTFTQDTATPDSLLIQIDTADLLEPARKRIEKYTDAKVLTLKTLRDNKSIDPDAQVSLAKHIDDNVDPYWPQLAWDNFPTFEQLKFAYELLWKFLVPQKRKKAGVASGFQLAVKTWQLYRSKDVALRIKAELKPGRFAAKTSDEAVERVLRFDRNWAGFELPRLLMALSRIYNTRFCRPGSCLSEIILCSLADWKICFVLQSWLRLTSTAFRFKQPSGFIRFCVRMMISMRHWPI